MRGLFIIAVWLMLAVASAAPQSKDRPSKSAERQKTEQKGKVSTMTGCIDEQDGHYVLVDEHNLNRIADLIAEGFPTEGFARHMGHKVTVRGIGSPNGAVPTFKVRTVETVSETCAPEAAQQRKQ